jgi:hypothetical protein
LLVNQALSSEAILSSAKRALGASRVVEASVPLILLGQRMKEIKRGNPRALAVAFWGAIQGIAEVLVWNIGASIPEADFILDILKRH